MELTLASGGDGYQINFTRKAGCDDFGCVDMQMNAMKCGDLTIAADEKLASGTPAETSDGCGAHGCAQFVQWKAKDGTLYMLRHMLKDDNEQHMSTIALLAMASAAEEIGPRKPR